MFNFKEIEFMKIYISLMYKYGYCYMDLSKEYLDDYLQQLRKLIESKKVFNNEKDFENMFIYDDLMCSYNNFINLLLYVTNNPINSFYNEKANIIMFNLSDEMIERNLNNPKYMDIEVVNKIVEFMDCYIGQKNKMKIMMK